MKRQQRVKNTKKKQSMYSVRAMMLIIILLIPMNLITLVMSVIAVRGMVSQLRENTEGTLRVYMSQIDSALTTAAVRSTFICQDNIDSIYLASRTRETEDSHDRKWQSIVKLSNSYNDYLKENGWVAGMFSVYPEQSDQVIGDNRYSFSNNRQIMQDYLDTRVSEKRALGKWECMETEDDAMLFYMSRFKNSYYGVWFDLKELVKVLKISDGDAALAFTDSEGKIVFKTAAAGQLHENLQDSGGPPEGGEGSSDPYSNVYSGIEKLILRRSNEYDEVRVSSSVSGLTLIQTLSFQRILNAFPAILRVMLLMSIAALFTLPIILFYMTKWVVQPVRKLNDAMEQISQGNMNYRIEEGLPGSEFERINREFNHTMEEVSRLKIDVYEQELEKQEIRLKFLSQQIQPHFILNTLNILYSYEQDEFPLIQKMILCLSRYFRYIVNANRDEVPLKAEMEHIRNYFEIQQARYPDTFFAFVEYDETIAGCMVPPLLIQNFAENSIKHSIKIGNHINIFVIAQPYGENKVQIRMLDTGQGIDQELIDRINIFRKTGVRQEGLGVGIQNAIERLNVLYGVDTEFSISRDEPHGTRIEIILPLKIGEEEE